MGTVYGIIVAIWVGHNISLARRRNRRKATENITVFPSHDYLGLPVEIHSNLVTEQEIEIRIVNGVKQYLPHDQATVLASLQPTATSQQDSVVKEADLVSEPGGPK